MFSSSRLPAWGLLELVVEAMGGDVPAFRELWRAAGTPRGPLVAPSVPMAGRTQELAAVRRHFTHGAGRLLLVTGEAGIGKTRLVTAAPLVADDVFVARGSCLPLSTEVPLLPVADLLRAVQDRDQGQSLNEAFANCPAYVPRAIARMLPEIEPLVSEPGAAGGAWERQQLFAAIRATLAALGEVSRFVVVIEDLHWGDSATLDLLVHLLTASGGPGVPVVGTYRTEDPSISATATEWRLLVQRLSSVEVLELGPLSQDGTAQQLALLGGEPPSLDLVEQIHRRAGGHPLFTEQLAAQADERKAGDAPLPRLLSDLLDQRLADIGEQSWPVARALGVADRGLTSAQLRDVTDLGAEALAARLHDLDRRRLLRTVDGHVVELRHPLLAEAIRRRLVAGEAADEHRRLAVALAASPDPSAAEVAEHWQGAGDAEQELVWRISAARAAGKRFAAAQEGEQWRRALELWPDGVTSAGSPGIRRFDAYLAAIDALEYIDKEVVLALAQDALSTLRDLSDLETAEILQRAGDFRGMLGQAEEALALLEQAVAIYQANSACEGYVHALVRLEYQQSAMGMHGKAAETSALAVAVSAGLGETTWHRWVLAILAMHDLAAGDVALARSRMEAAESIELAEPDPTGETFLSAIHTDFLLRAGAGADEVAAAGRRGLEAAATWGLETEPLSFVRANVAMAMRREGQVSRASRLIDPVTSAPPIRETLPVHCERADLDVRRGRLEAALARFDELSALPMAHLGNRIEFHEHAAEAELWGSRPGEAEDRMVALLEEALADNVSADVGTAFVLAARAAADLADSRSRASATRRELLVSLQGLRSRARRDLFEPRPAWVERPALAAAWSAETARLAGAPTLELWAAAACAWDTLTRPHDAAYCRWRAAQVAQRTGQTGAAVRLLRRAADDAREHVPLLTAIRETAAHPAGGRRRSRCLG
ncbi:MAG: AAA family ATPase [Marmoricola sp.]